MHKLVVLSSVTDVKLYLFKKAPLIENIFIIHLQQDNSQHT